MNQIAIPATKGMNPGRPVMRRHIIFAGQVTKPNIMLAAFPGISTAFTDAQSLLRQQVVHFSHSS